MDLDWKIISFAIIAIVGVTEYIKSVDKKEKIKSLYPYIPLVLSVFAGLILDMINDGFYVWHFLFYSIINISLSTLGYKVIVKLVKEKIKQLRLK